MTHLAVAIFGIAALLPAACAAPPAPGGSLPGPAYGGQGHEQEWEDRMTRLMDRAGIPGLAAAVIQDGTIVLSGAFGVKNVETGERVDENTVFEAASLSKPVFAYIVMRLAEQGVIDLDTPLADILPHPRLEHDDRYRRITARMVLSHTTGLPNWGGTPLQLAFEPGGGWGYSGEGYVYLQKVIEVLTDLPLDELARNEVFKPLGMPQSSFVWRRSYRLLAATGHDELGVPQPKNRPREGGAASTLHTTAVEYARFVSALIAGRGLAPGSVDQMLSPQVRATGRGRMPEPAALYWGLGWGIEQADGDALFWHWGDNGDFRCFIVADRRGSGIVYLTNSRNGFSVVSHVGRRFIHGLRETVPWLGYESFDEPLRVARLELERAFLDHGAEAGLERYRRLRTSDAATIVDAAMIEAVARSLVRRDRRDDAFLLLEAGAADHPDALGILRALGDVCLADGDIARATASFGRVLELAPDDEAARQGLAWIDEGRRAAAAPVTIPEATLRRYRGRYGPRKVTLRRGVLSYARRGAGRKYHLVPMKVDTFALDGLPTFRLRFVSDPDGPVTAVIGLYADGRTDESIRGR